MKIQAFSKTYQKKCVLSFPDYTLEPGKIYAIIGANGSGKSTFAKILAGTLESDQKVDPIAGFKESDQKVNPSAFWEESYRSDKKASIGFLPQKPYPFRMTTFQNLMINAEGSKDNARQKAAELLQALGLAELSDTLATTLSGGETARMCLARLLMREYDLYLLDEPCAAMDIPSTLQTEELIRDHCKKTGATFLIITHSLQQARRISDNTLFFYQGQLKESGPTNVLLNNPEKAETREFLEFFS